MIDFVLSKYNKPKYAIGIKSQNLVFDNRKNDWVCICEYLWICLFDCGMWFELGDKRKGELSCLILKNYK